jgi:DNA-binding NarL/FixJ family response regulator
MKPSNHITMHPSIKVAIIEDDHDIRQLMQLIVDGSPGFFCKQVYEGCKTGVPALIEDPVDIVLMDIDMPEMSGIDGVAWLKEELPKVNVIMLTVHEDNEAVFDSLCAGAVGYLVKGLPPVDLLRAIEEAHQGGSPMSPAIARKVVRSFQPRVTTDPLSGREKEILKLLCDGENYKTIATSLFISTNTVKAHIKNIYEKLQVHTRAEAVGKALKQRLVK